MYKLTNAFTLQKHLNNVDNKEIKKNMAIKTYSFSRIL